MRFSFTGDRPEAILLLRDLAADRRHTLAACCLTGALRDQADDSLPADVEPVDAPEAALVVPDCDGVVVAVSDTDQSVRYVRHASQADRHVIVVPPADASIAWSYELSLLQDEGCCGIVVACGALHLPDEPPVLHAGREYEVGLPDETDAAASRIRLMWAVDAVRALGAADRQVTVLDISPNGRRIILSDPPGDQTARPAVTLRTSETAAPGLLLCRSAGSTAAGQIVVPGFVSPETNRQVSGITDRAVRLLGSRPLSVQALERFSETLQVIAAIDLSARRRRTVDVSLDDLTERAAFKTQMTVIGCGVLTWMLIGLIGYLLIGQFLSPPTGVMLFLRALWVVPLVLFLAAQLLLPLARGSVDTERPVPHESPDRTD